MKVVNLSEAKNNLSRYVEQARRGERVRILVRGVPVAQLAAGLVLVRDKPRHRRFVASDGPLADAAEAEGFEVIVPR